MGILEIILAILVVILLFKIAVWLFGYFKVPVPQDLLVIIALVILILILLGRFRIGL